jgi:hypothetical protein
MYYNKNKNRCSEKGAISMKKTVDVAEIIKKIKQAMEQNAKDAKKIS